MMPPMRNFLWLALVSCLGLVALGCNTFDPVAACESRCERRKAMGCEPSSTQCDNSCVLADDIYDDGLDRAEAAGCVSQYQTYVECLISTPPCATDTVLAEMCGEEYLILENCW